ncbi:hypothetical protein [Brevibacillus borstelensis]|uniref:hypothetical protein n=1 Tax=Brevibacillus borstelensis TaxID=45462 RepID=UPI0030C4A611
MKLISVQDAMKRIEQCAQIPDTHEVIKSGIFRNSERNQTPLFRVEVEWNKRGEPELDEEGLVSKHTIRAELDALTGHVIAYYRHDYRTDEEMHEKDIDDRLYEKVYEQVRKWIEKLGLPITPAELAVRKKLICNEKWYELSFSRQYAGIPFRSYQTFDIRLSTDFALLHLFCRWDDCTCEKEAALIPAEELLAGFTENQVSLYYLPVLSLEKPFYVCNEIVIHARTGEILSSDEIEVLDEIALCRDDCEPMPEVKWNEQPIFTEGRYEQLRLDDHVKEVDIDSPHPFHPALTEEEKNRAKELVRSYLSTHYADEPFEYMYIRKPDQDCVEGFSENRVVVHVYRMIHRIPLMMGGGIRFFFDRDTWELVQTFDALDFWNKAKAEKAVAIGQEARETQGNFRKALRTRAEAWNALKSKITVKQRYMFDPHYSDPDGLGRKKAIPVWVIDCDWMYDGLSGELVEL